MPRQITTVVFFMFISLLGFSQNITLSTQAEVDAFDTSITNISGYLSIEDNGTDPITDLSNLSNVVSVQSNFFIKNNDSLINLVGLSNLMSLEGLFSIENNSSLENIDGLSSLTTITGLIVITDNPSLENLDGLSNITSISDALFIINNSGLTNCCGIKNLISTPGAVGGSITIGNNPSECSNQSEVMNSDCIYSIYVDETATGNNDGSTWANAFVDLQDALASGLHDTIRIAEGIYKPTSGTQKGKSFDLPTNSVLLGGYPSGGGIRNPESYSTILSGEIDNIPGFSGNSYHVVKVINADNVIIDGLDIKDGNASNNATYAWARGGGIYCSGAELTLRNVTLRRNKAIYGGGLFAKSSPEVRIEDCEIKLNQADYAAAIYHSNETNIYLSRTKIIDNDAAVRCAIEVNNSQYTEIENCIIANNESTNANAIAFIATNRDQTCFILNTTILGGTANKNLITFQVGNNDQLDVYAYNSIIAHQNPSFDKNVKLFGNGTLNFEHGNCYFQGMNVIGIGINTLFSSIDGTLGLNADYSAANCSPIVDAGDNAALFSNTDIEGNDRVYNGTIDIGAHENQGDCALPRAFAKEELVADEFLFRISPNPANNILNINTNLENYEIIISDILGKKIISMANKEIIDIGLLPKGTYLVSIFENGEFKKVNKLVKN